MTSGAHALRPITDAQLREATRSQHWGPSSWAAGSWLEELLSSRTQGKLFFVGPMTALGQHSGPEGWPQGAQSSKYSCFSSPGDMSSRHFKPEIRVTSLRFSPTGEPG